MWWGLEDVELLEGFIRQQGCEGERGEENKGDDTESCGFPTGVELVEGDQPGPLFVHLGDIDAGIDSGLRGYGGSYLAHGFGVPDSAVKAEDAFFGGIDCPEGGRAFVAEGCGAGEFFTSSLFGGEAFCQDSVIDVLEGDCVPADEFAAEEMGIGFDDDVGFEHGVDAGGCADGDDGEDYHDDGGWAFCCHEPEAGDGKDTAGDDSEDASVVGVDAGVVYIGDGAVFFGDFVRVFCHVVYFSVSSGGVRVPGCCELHLRGAFFFC